MRYVFKDLSEINKKLKNKYLFIFLDCDGTLTPIVDTPEKVIITPETKRILAGLSQKDDCAVAIISGRTLGDLKKKFGLKNIIYSGNHGFQISGPKLKREQRVTGEYKKILRRLKRGLEHELSGIKGVFLELKEFSLALHFRLVSERYIPFIKKTFYRAVSLYLEKNKIKVRPAKKVLEIMPPVNWDKGEAVLWLVSRKKSRLKDKLVMPVYIGDDFTDEDAFRVLRKSGMGVFVGPLGSSQAKYYLKNVKEVRGFLSYILDTVNER